ncbi:YdbL family protein [Allosphingosinicella sp.]|uniref:YdbL family protein n=1 Tax=Allosphingosinicella sp. TaxID=2823234 RepID=UPI002F16B49D
MRPLALLAGAALAVAGLGGSAAAAQDTAAALRATALVGERFDGYLGLVGPAPSSVRQQVEAINIRRRSHYTHLASRRGVRLEEVAVAVACEILATRVLPGQYYLLPDNVWRRRGSEPVPRPDVCD